MTTKPVLLTPDNCQVIFIDHQPQMAFGVANIDRQTLKNNVVALAKASKLYGIPTILTTVETDSFSGHMIPELLEVFPDHDVIERTSMNSFDDANVREALAKAGRKKVVVSGLWTGICNNMFAFSAMEEEGYEIFMVEDASGDTSAMAHDAAMRRMEQAGVVPMTTIQTMLEWQRDWARRDSYDGIMDIVREHGGAYGMGVDYAYSHVHKAPPRVAPKRVVGPVGAANADTAA
jgi:nicotinamidase-related amidase